VPPQSQSTLPWLLALLLGAQEQQQQAQRQAQEQAQQQVQETLAALAQVLALGLLQREPLLAAQSGGQGATIPPESAGPMLASGHHDVGEGGAAAFAAQPM
jgi:hypothetical protein